MGKQAIENDSVKSSSEDSFVTDKDEEINDASSFGGFNDLGATTPAAAEANADIFKQDEINNEAVGAD